MRVFSYPELYTSLLGWNIADNVQTLLLSVGAPAIAYIIVTISMWARVRGTDDSVDRITDIFRARHSTFVLGMAALTVLMLLAKWTTISASTVTYQPEQSIYTSETPQAITAESDTTSASNQSIGAELNEVSDDSGSGYEVGVPVGAYFPITLINWFNVALINLTPDTTDVIAIRSNIAAARATDPTTASNLGKFINDCYLPARERIKEYQELGVLFSVGDAGNFVSRGVYGSDDDWPGSEEYFTPCLYGKCTLSPLITYGSSLQSSSPVVGFNFDGDTPSSRDYKFNTGTTGAGGNEYGYPYCQEWWEEVGGIKDQLQTAYEQSYLPEIAANETVMDILERKFVGLHDFFDDEDLQLKAMFDNTLAAYQRDPYYIKREKPGYQDTFNSVSNALGGNVISDAAAAQVAVADAGLDVLIGLGRQVIVPITSKYREAGEDAAILLLPMYQAYILMIMTALFPAVVICSGFNFRVVGTYLGAYAGVRIANGVWAWAYWFDVLINSHIYQGVTSWADDANRSLFIYGFYYGGAAIAVFLVSLLGWKGGDIAKMSIGAAVQSAQNISNTNSSAAGAIVNTVSGALRGGLGKGKGGGSGGGTTVRQRYAQHIKDNT